MIDDMFSHTSEYESRQWDYQRAVMKRSNSLLRYLKTLTSSEHIHWMCESLWCFARKSSFELIDACIRGHECHVREHRFECQATAERKDTQGELWSRESILAFQSASVVQSNIFECCDKLIKAVRFESSSAQSSNLFIVAKCYWIFRLFQSKLAVHDVIIE